jgi:Ni,Fe-hydrogenase III component G
MTREEVINNLKTKFENDIISIFDKSPKRVYLEIKPDTLIALVRYLFFDVSARFNTATGVDTHQHIEILYHFTIEDINLLISLRVKLPKSEPAIDSLALFIEGTNWIEREIHEMLGIDFKGHPELSRFLLPEEWPESVYPLRREYKEWDKSAIRDRGV